MADKETIVTMDGGDSGSGVLIALVVFAALIVILFLMLGRGMLSGGTQKIDADIKIATPAKGG